MHHVYRDSNMTFSFPNEALHCLGKDWSSEKTINKRDNQMSKTSPLSFLIPARSAINKFKWFIKIRSWDFHFCIARNFLSCVSSTAADHLFRRAQCYPHTGSGYLHPFISGWPQSLFIAEEAYWNCWMIFLHRPNVDM